MLGFKQQQIPLTSIVWTKKTKKTDVAHLYMWSHVWFKRNTSPSDF